VFVYSFLCALYETISAVSNKSSARVVMVMPGTMGHSGSLSIPVRCLEWRKRNSMMEEGTFYLKCWLN